MKTIKLPQRKPRSDSTLQRLPEAQREAIVEWLGGENRSYRETVKRVEERFGVVVSVAAVQRFYARCVVPWRAARAGEAAGALCAAKAGKIGEATERQLRVLAFEALVAREPDVRVAATLLKLVDNAARTELLRQKVSLEERRVAVLEQAHPPEPEREELTLEEKEDRIRAVFGMAPKAEAEAAEAEWRAKMEAQAREREAREAAGAGAWAMTNDQCLMTKDGGGAGGPRLDGLGREKENDEEERESARAAQAEWRARAQAREREGEDAGAMTKNQGLVTNVAVAGAGGNHEEKSDKFAYFRGEGVG
jgi:hypothetical protein